MSIRDEESENAAGSIAEDVEGDSESSLAFYRVAKVFVRVPNEYTNQLGDTVLEGDAELVITHGFRENVGSFGRK